MHISNIYVRVDTSPIYNNYEMCAFLKIKKINPFNFMDVYINIVFYHIECIAYIISNTHHVSQIGRLENEF